MQGMKNSMKENALNGNFRMTMATKEMQSMYENCAETKFQGCTSARNENCNKWKCKVCKM